MKRRFAIRLSCEAPLGVYQTEMSERWGQSMARTSYNFEKKAKEKARQQKQLEKASKRLLARQQTTDAAAGAPADPSGAEESESTEETMGSAE